MALGEQVQTPSVTGRGGRAQCPCALSRLQDDGVLCFSCQLSRYVSKLKLFTV